MSASILDRLANGSGTGETPSPSAPAKPNVITDGDVHVMTILYDASCDPNAQRFLPWMWDQLVADGTVALYFPDEEQTGFASFVKLMSSGVPILLVVRTDAEGNIQEHNGLVGFASLEIMRFGSTVAAHAGFIFLRQWWDRVTTIAAGREIMRTWFGWSAPKVDVIMGVTARTNVPVRRFLQRLGWTLSGMIPMVHRYHGKQADAEVWYVTRGQEGVE